MKIVNKKLVVATFDDLKNLVQKAVKAEWNGEGEPPKFTDKRVEFDHLSGTVTWEVQ